MSLLQNRIAEDYKAALKSGDATRKTTLSGVRAAVKNAEIENRDAPTDDARVLSVLQKEAKKRREAIEEYDKAHRPDLAEKERAELGVLEAYLPAQMNEDELAAIVQNAIASTGAHSAKDMGRIMGVVLPLVEGRADGKRVSALVRTLLS